MDSLSIWFCNQSINDDIDDLTQLYHDGYRAGLEEAAKFADETGGYEIADWCRMRATELEKEPAP